MKRINLLAILFLTIITAMAQDVIVMKNGDVIQSKVQKITKTEIEYKKFSNLNGPTYTIEKTDVFVINYENGEKEIITAEETAAPKEEQVTKVVDYAISEEENERLKQKYCIEVKMTEKDAKKEMKKKDKDARSFFCQMDFTKEAQLADANIEIEVQTLKCEFGERSYPKALWCANNQGLQITVKNKTDKVVFIDLANTFFVRGDQAEPYYVPSATSSMSGGTTGTSINLGGIAGAFGVNGAAGKLASGINVGGSTSKMQTTTTYSQRIVSIPPMSSKKLDPMLIVTPDSKDAYDCKVINYDVKKNEGYCPYWEKMGVKRGEVYNWTETDTKFRMTSFVTYSFEESMEQTHSVKTGLYVKKLIALPRPVGGYMIPTANIVLEDNFKESLYFVGEFR